MRRDCGLEKGQSLSEYAVLFVVVAAAILGMQTYVRRGIQNQVKRVADEALAISPLDLIDPNFAKRGEATQRKGLEVKDETVTLPGSTNIAEQETVQAFDLGETRVAGGVVTRTGTTRHESPGRSIFTDTSEVPPDFLLRSAAFERLGSTGSSTMNVRGDGFGVTGGFSLNLTSPGAPAPASSPPPASETPPGEPEKP